MYCFCHQLALRVALKRVVDTLERHPIDLRLISQQYKLHGISIDGQITRMMYLNLRQRFMAISLEYGHWDTCSDMAET